MSGVERFSFYISKVGDYVNLSVPSLLVKKLVVQRSNLPMSELIVLVEKSPGLIAHSILPHNTVLMSQGK